MSDVTDVGIQQWVLQKQAYCGFGETVANHLTDLMQPEVRIDGTFGATSTGQEADVPPQVIQIDTVHFSQVFAIVPIIIHRLFRLSVKP